MSERHVIDDRNRHENVNGTTLITKNFSNELAMEARHYCITGREIAPNTGANATKFFTLATKS